MLDRRQFVASTTAVLAAALGLPAFAATEAATQPEGGKALTDMLDGYVQRLLRNSPMSMTMLGLDVGPAAAARGEMDDRTPAGLEHTRSIFADLARDLARYDPATLTGADWINHQSAAYMASTTLQSFTFPFGDPNIGTAVPYIVSQLSGSARNTPTFLTNQHPIETAQDAEYYLARLSGFAEALDVETARSREDYKRGATPPDFVLKTTLVQLSELLAAAPADSDLVKSIAGRTKAKGIEGDWQARATALVQREVYPALERQAALIREALASAPPEAGVWRLPQGEEYYRFAIRGATTTDMPAEDIHRLGLELVARFSAEADKILRQKGLTQGTVGQRISSLRRMPEHLFPNTDEGRAALIAYGVDLNEKMQARLPQWFGRLPKSPVVIERMSPAIEAGGPGAFYLPPVVDAGRPGQFIINLRDTANQPRFDLPTLIHHEALPGHHLQNALMMEATELPQLRRLPLFAGYLEGWGLYAEQLADEMGVYENDPLGRLGYLASMLFRAARLVVDSGLHHKRWTREQAIAYMRETLGESEDNATREVERYCVQPGQACSYMLGWQVWTDTRSRAQARLGERFDIRAFHDRALLAGNMPLDVLARVIDDWT
ncbi:MAG TPA: DUF885 family protein [Pedomonas sp.]|uniref:DUF885 domain-containing protein n=1 Tax=Pedomonas sp. TaxID=2976421 RepID=UPI002F40F810